MKLIHIATINYQNILNKVIHQTSYELYSIEYKEHNETELTLMTVNDTKVGERNCVHVEAVFIENNDRGKILDNCIGESKKKNAI